jgi:hypothetical protein
MAMIAQIRKLILVEAGLLGFLANLAGTCLPSQRARRSYKGTMDQKGHLSVSLTILPG